MGKLDTPNSFRNGPDEHGRFGLYGGRFVAETLMPLILELEAAYEAAKLDPPLRPNSPICTPTTSAAPRPSISPSGSPPTAAAPRSTSSGTS